MNERQGPEEGLKGTARATLNLFDHNHVQAIPKYARFVREHSGKAWAELCKPDLLALTPEKRNIATVNNLKDHLQIKGLCSWHMARYLEYADPIFFDQSLWDGVGRNFGTCCAMAPP